MTPARRVTRRIVQDNRPPQWLLSASAWRDKPRRGGLLHGLQLRHLRSGRSQRFDYGDHQVMEEHIVVPKPGKRGELDAWLLGKASTPAARPRC